MTHASPELVAPAGPLPRCVPLSLATARLRLRFPIEADAAALHAYYGDADSVRYTTRRAFTEAETWRAVAGMAGHWALRGYGPYTVTARDDGRVLGVCGPWFPGDWPEPEIKWALLPAARGRGIAREAAHAVRTMLDAHLPALQPISLILDGNAASIAVAQAVGAQRERTLMFRDAPAAVYRHGAAAAWPTRRAVAADADAVADVYLASRRVHVAFAPLAHDAAQVRRWLATQVLPAGGTWVAQREGVVAAMLVLSTDARGTQGAQPVHWIDHLYVTPTAVGHGLGRALMQVALREAGRPLRLFTFAQNDGARRFYERLGFVARQFGDGRDNEEGRPDVLYELN
ncbi:MAG: GNAT family N-acetyltransferase [Burkholderiaceae bacterium]|jgi:RimJ/RimL family protein N-acetyltransferase|nr:GNAT family N-acetyltransferase [Burkholderiaceae bacterium]